MSLSLVFYFNWRIIHNLLMKKVGKFPGGN